MITTHRVLTAALAVSILTTSCATDAELDELPVDTTSRAATVTGVATWKNDALGAYTVILDDAGTWPSISGFATAELNRRGLTAGLGAIVKSIQDRSATEIPALKAAAAAGQEIVNHSWTHVPNATSGCDGIMLHACGGGLGAAKEVNEARTWLQTNLQTTVSFFIYPYDYRNADVAAMVAVNHLGDRSGWGATGAAQGVNSANVGDYNLAFELAGASDLSLADLNGYVDRAITARGWALREMHGVGDGSWGNVSQAEWTGHLDHVVSQRNAGRVWMAGPSTVIKYKRVRQGACGTPQITGDRLTFSNRTSATCVRYATVVSVVLSSSTTLTATQGGQRLEVINKGSGRYIVNMDPTRGDVTLGGGTCTPTTCAAQGKNCGTISNGCGGTLSCGTCGSGQTCSATNVCQSSCTPTTCAAQGKNCGTIANGCGGTLSCGTCASGQTCSTTNVCQGGSSCSPTIASYSLGRCNATVVYNGKLHKCISQAAGVNGEPTGCGTPGVYCGSIAPDNAAWGATAWQFLQNCP